MNDHPPIRELAATIAKELGATLLPKREGREHDEQYPRIVTAEGPELSLSYHWQTKRLATGINLPTYTARDGSTQHQSPRELEYIVKADHGSEPDTSITTDPKRDAGLIARDIKRRLLPGAIVWHQAALKRKAQMEAHAAGVKSTIEKLCKALKHKQDARHGETLYLPRVRLQVSSPDSVRFESFYVDAETAITIHKLITACKEGA